MTVRERELLSKVGGAFGVLNKLGVPNMPRGYTVPESPRETCAYFYDEEGREFYVTVRQTAGPA